VPGINGDGLGFEHRTLACPTTGNATPSTPAHTKTRALTSRARVIRRSRISS
jgi:hypothetical protein